jgi:hypothetical protein
MGLTACEAHELLSQGIAGISARAPRRGNLSHAHFTAMRTSARGPKTVVPAHAANRARSWVCPRSTGVPFGMIPVGLSLVME